MSLVVGGKKLSVRELTQQPEKGQRDYVEMLTVREFSQLLKEIGIELSDLADYQKAVIELESVARGVANA
jgi:hypothetical protein